MYSKVSVQQADFNVGEEIRQLQQSCQGFGAISSFIGVVRDSGDLAEVTSLELEHCPGITEKVLTEIAADAATKFSLAGVVIIHRVGKIELGQQIVLVVCAAAHRHAAFTATNYIMDILKTTAPFWKKEVNPTQQRWVNAKDSDKKQSAKWLK